MENGVTNRQLFFVIIISTIGFSIIQLPKIMGEAAGTGALFTLLLAALFFSFDIFMIAYLGNAYRGKTLFEYSRLLTGKFVSYCFTAIYIPYFIVMLAFVIRSSADIIKAEILYKTPIIATMLLITAVSLYTASKGLTIIGRVIEFLGFIILAIGFILNFITFNQGNVLNVLPLLDSDMSIYFRALPSTIFGFVGFEVITNIPFTKSNGVKTIWTAIIAILVLCFFSIFVVESCYTVLGTDDILNYDYPLIIAIRRLDIDILQFAKRLDLFFIIIWLSSAYCSISMLIFTAAGYTKKLIPKANLKILLITISILACFIGLLIPSAEKVQQYFIWFVTYLSLIPVFIIPFILFMIHIFKSLATSKRSVVKNSEESGN